MIGSWDPASKHVFLTSSVGRRMSDIVNFYMWTSYFNVFNHAFHSINLLLFWSYFSIVWMIEVQTIVVRLRLVFWSPPKREWWSCCERSRPGLSQLWVVILLWEVSSGSESVRLLARQAENSTSGWGSFWESSPLGSWFSTSAFRYVPRTVPENVRICGIKRNSSNLDSAPKTRDSVPLNSW